MTRTELPRRVLVGPPKRMEVFDWCDGPREGVCTFAPPVGDVHFRLLGERPTSDGLDQRIFALSSLPDGTVERAASSHDVDDIVSGSGPPFLVIATENFETIDGQWSYPEEEPEDWFAWVTEREVEAAERPRGTGPL